MTVTTQRHSTTPSHVRPCVKGKNAVYLEEMKVPGSILETTDTRLETLDTDPKKDPELSG